MPIKMVKLLNVWNLSKIQIAMIKAVACSKDIKILFDIKIQLEILNAIYIYILIDKIRNFFKFLDFSYLSNIIKMLQ